MGRVSVDLWSGRHVRALREAKRLTIQEFAGKLGVSERMVSKWEAQGEAIHPRPVNQSALDTFLESSDEREHERFARAGLSQETAPVQAATLAVAATEEPVIDLDQSIRHPHDGKLMVAVEAGTFISGGANDTPLWLPEFYIDVYPTTNADYARFLTATGRTPPYEWDSTLATGQLADHPVVFVTWHDAAAYSDWAGKQLPTGHQWEKAARGTRGDLYPWGSRLTPAKCNIRESGLRATTPVDRYQSGVSPYGVYDLCGNTWEWCRDQSEAGRHELKGSAFTSPFARCTPSNFNDASADMCDDDTSFRCVTLSEELAALQPA